jgi:hypothetical protein
VSEVKMMVKKNEQKKYTSLDEVLKDYFPNTYEEEVLSRTNPYEYGTVFARESLEKHKHLLATKESSVK